jgi:hypothetical protein
MSDLGVVPAVTTRGDEAVGLLERMVGKSLDGC